MKENIQWKDAPMPDSSPGTKLSTLFVSDTIERSRLMLVEFPKGFSRETTGHYPAYEELFIISGSLEISGYTFKENDYVLFPPNFTRSDTACPEGCFAIVWWSHKPSWCKGPNENPDNNLISKESNNINEAFINLLQNDEFHSIFLGRDNTTSDINEEFIGVDIDNYDFVQGDSLDSLDNGRYFLKINKF